MLSRLFRRLRTKTSTIRKAKRPGKRLSMESLEQRVVLSVSPGTATLVDGELVVCGTDADNTIIVSANEDGQIFVAADFLTEPQTFSATGVTLIRVTGEAGNDTIVCDGLMMEATIEGGAGNDTLIGSAFNDTILGDAGDDIIYGGAGDDTVTGGEGVDRVFGQAGDDTVNGGDGNDILVGDAGDDTLNGNGGDDTLLGAAGNDTADGGADIDTIVGGPDGNDTLMGGAGDDMVFGNSGDDALDGGEGNDTVMGDEGNDTVAGSGGDDMLVGGAGDDSITGSGGNDSLFGGSGADALSGGNGNDGLLGGDAGDVLIGGSGEDTLQGQGGEDVLVGGSTADENDLTALAALATDWSGSGSYDDRLSSVSSRLASGANDDASVDAMVGADGRDSFFSAATDNITDQSNDEVTVGRDLSLANDTYQVIAGEVLTVSAANGVLANDVNPNPGATTVSTAPVTPPTSGTLTLAADGSFTYTPTTTTGGSDSFTYSATDSSSNETRQATVTITISETNSAPIAADAATFTVTEGASFSTSSGVNDLLIDASDPDGDTLTTTVATKPSNGTVELGTDGNFTYTPNSDFFGFDSFTYRVSDGTLDSAESTVSLVVSGDNRFAIFERTAADSVVGRVTLPSNITSPAAYELAAPSGTPDILQLNPDDHIEGDPSAPLLMIEYVDYQCSACALFHPIVANVLSNFEGGLAVVSRHLPLQSNSLVAARAAEAAAQQGSFKEMSDLLFDRQTAWSGLASDAATTTFEGYATELGLDLTQFQSDFASEATLERITRDSDGARNDLGFSGTPQFVLDNQPLDSGPLIDEAVFTQTIQDELANLSQAFTIDRITGDIRVLDPALLDFETNAEFTLDVVVGDGTNRETVPVSIKLGDQANENVIFPLAPLADVTTTSSGLQTHDFKTGSGDNPSASDSVVVRYVGYLPDGSVFDSNENATFPLSNLIQGFSEGVQGMQVGGTRRMMIPPDIGYGPNGNAGAGIGGTDTIVFDVTLKSIV